MNERYINAALVCLAFAVVVMSAGCTGVMAPVGGGTRISDNNLTHQQWYSQHDENPDKYMHNPENPFEWTLKGMASVAWGGNHEGALEYYDTAIGLDLEFGFVYYEKGFSLLNLKRYDEAKECFQKAIELNPDFKPLVEKDLRTYVRD
ncbi:tetratricopeptide repeat protein [Methanolacinia paynteri]|uniref:tetratricopeptide repeat protein n=1 Tax=Methanolacinia paynteri TaxID=230356 RepID=UPI00064E21C9|nr:tetratricopeptide repeat protein [Methanolacinia paynteri]